MKWLKCMIKHGFYVSFFPSRIKVPICNKNEQFNNNILHANTHKSMQKLIMKYNLF